MKVGRRILGVVIGYLIFAVSAAFLFRLTGHNPHAPQSTLFMLSSIAYGIVFAAAGGYVSAALGGGSPRVQGGVVALIIALGATVSLLTASRVGSAWSMLAALFLMAPSAAVGGILRARRDTPTHQVQ